MDDVQEVAIIALLLHAVGCCIGWARNHTKGGKFTTPAFIFLSQNNDHTLTIKYRR